METDSLFYQLFKQLPQTLFELIDMPVTQANSYRFDAVELKKSLRVDGLFMPNKVSLPLCFVEVQFQRLATFYANLFAKVFCYLEENNPSQEWMAVAIFPSRKLEPKELKPYEELLRSNRVKRIYLDECAPLPNPPLGAGVLRLLFASEREAEILAPRLMQKVHRGLAGGDLELKVVELVERVLLRRFPGLNPEEMRMKFKLHDIRESKVWKEAFDDGDASRLRKTVDTLISKGKTLPQIAELLDIPLRELRRVVKDHPASGG